MRSHLLAFVPAALCLSLLLFVCPAEARQAEITRLDGSTLVGEVIDETPKAVTLRIAGIPTTVQRSEIRTVRFLPTIEEQYNEKRAQIADDDAKALYDLMFWLYENKAHALAKKELPALIERFPDDRKFKLLQILVDDAITKENKPEVVTPRPPVKPPDQPPVNGDKPPREKPADVPRVEEQDINVIRIYEMDFTPSRKPRVLVPRKVIDELLEEFKGKPGIPLDRNGQARFRAMAGWEQLMTIMRLSDHGTRKYYKEIEVRDDPAPMMSFRSEVHPRYIVSYCATANCHGSMTTSKFYLFNTDVNTPATVYSNFYILASYQNEHGLMIDRAEPERSLLIQYGLPRSEAVAPHPTVEPPMQWVQGLRNGRRDAMYNRLVNWIGEELYRPAPHYDILYKIPVGNPPPKPEKPADGEPVPPADPSQPKTQPGPVDGAAPAPAPVPPANELPSK